ncbi:MAG: transglycosylase domain-containing protein [Clostridium sp.]|nr:transglycosylase domain-containing protein [Clostridium sp.]
MANKNNISSNTQEKRASGIKPLYKKIIKWMWIAFAAIVIMAAAFLILIYNGVIGYMPELDQLKNPQDKFATAIYTSDGVEMGRYFRNTGNRVYADYADISQHVIDALIATEDERFMKHSGIDAKALSRVLVKTLMMQNKNAGGGSTITQQLAKQLYSPESSGLLSRAMQKPIEWMIAVKLERQYSKEEILKMYLNQFDFLYNAVGIKSAANVYFGKDAKDLNIEEAAMLVGMVKNPAYYNPRRHPERTENRRNVVLEQMYRGKLIDRQQLDSLTKLPIKLDYHAADHKEGIAPYFREELRRFLLAKKPVRKNYMAWEGQKFKDDSILWETNALYGWVEKNPKPDGSKWDIYNDGLKIFTTIDSRMQAHAEEAVQTHMEDLQNRFFREKKTMSNAPYSSLLTAAEREKHIQTAIRQSERYRVAKKVAMRSDEEIEEEFNRPVEMTVFSYTGPIDTVMTPRDSILYIKHFLRTGFMSMDPRNGYVKAYVGGPNFKFFQYDMVSTGRRQVGSTIKPFLYTLAMEEGMTPCTQFLNTQPTLIDGNGKPWSPRNAGTARVGEMVDLRWALTNSNNWISARVMDVVRPNNLVRLMHNMGITNELPAVVSLCLGPSEISVKEMVTAYSAYANYGMKTDPMFVTAITDSNGTVISNFAPQQTEVISQKAYYRILSILLNVVDGGTGNRLRRPPYSITAQTGGKTGTTNDNSDGWFMAFTPELVSGVWVGGDERDIHFNTMANGQGASMALPIYGNYIRAVYDDPKLNYTQDTRFEFPADLDLCSGTYDAGVVSEKLEESVEGVFD